LTFLGEWGNLTEHDVSRSVALFQAANLPYCRLKNMTVDCFIERMALDKKSTRWQFTFGFTRRAG